MTYTYDNDGNMITATTGSGTTTYTYDYENRLTNVEVDGTMVATYTYDALGRRIGIDDSGTQTWTVFNGKSADANPYADFNSSGTLKMRYLDGLAVDEILARTDSSGNTVVVPDRPGRLGDRDRQSPRRVPGRDHLRPVRQHRDPDRCLPRPIGSCSRGWNTIRRLGFTTIMPDIMMQRLGGL